MGRIGQCSGGTLPLISCVLWWREGRTNSGLGLASWFMSKYARLINLKLFLECSCENSYTLLQPRSHKNGTRQCEEERSCFLLLFEPGFPLSFISSVLKSRFVCHLMPSRPKPQLNLASAEGRKVSQGPLKDPIHSRYLKDM